jgi:hypothetical protein
MWEKNMVWDKAVMSCFQILSENCDGRAEKKYEQNQKLQPLEYERGVASHYIAN